MWRRTGLLILCALAAGCSTALSSIRDADLSKIHLGQSRAEVEQVVGWPDHKEPRANGGLRITYNLRLDRPSSDELRWDSLNASGATIDVLGQGDWGCLAIIPLTIAAATFVVAEGVATTKEVYRLSQGNSYEFIVDYDEDGRVVSKGLRLMHRPRPADDLTVSGIPSDSDLNRQWRSAQRRR